MYEIPREWVLFANFNNGNEEDLDDFPVENQERLAESLVGSYRAESTDQCTIGSGITTKIPQLYGGSTSLSRKSGEQLDHTSLISRDCVG